MASSSSSSSSSLSSSTTFTLPLFLLLLSTTNMMIITMTTAFDLRPQSNNNDPLLLSTTRIRIRLRSYPQPPCLLSNNNKGSNNYRSRRQRGEQQLYMGGYYAEDLTNDNIDNNYDNEDRSKTHMIFGVRCIEKEKSFLIPTTTTTTTITEMRETAKIDTIEVTVTGLQPLLKDDDDDEDDEDDSVVLREDDNNNDDDDFVSILLEQANRSLQKIQKLRVLEIGADPLFSLALSKLISSTISSTGTDDNDGVTHSVTIYHPNERRLRVLDHAYQFFNEIRTSNKCSFQTVPLKNDEFLNIDSDSTNDNAIHVNCCSSWIVFTSAKLVSKRLDAVMTIVAAKSIMANTNHRVFVPSSIIPNEQLKRYNYHVVAMGSSLNNNDKIGNDVDGSILLEILNSNSK